MTQTHTRMLAVATSAGAIALLLGGSLAFAETKPGAADMRGREAHGRMGMHGPMMGDGQRPGVFGTATAISGSTITLESRGFGPNGTTTTYAVDASSATIDKDRATSTISSIAPGDTLMVLGTVTGSAVKATVIHDGRMPHGGMMGEKRGWDTASTSRGMMGGTVSAPHSEGPVGGIGGFFRHLFGF